MLDAEFRDRAVYLPRTDALVVADVHVGRDEASSVEFPLGERSDLSERLDALLLYFSPATVVFAGDVLHPFDAASDRTVAALEAIVDSCREKGVRPVLVAGNHDTALAGVWDGPVHDAFFVDDVLVTHGHEVPDREAATYVVGHDHPAIVIEGKKRPCYLYGPNSYRGGDVLMLPAFNRLARGTVVNDMRTTDFQTPLVSNAAILQPIVYDSDSHETLRFPPLGRLRRLL
ncbi:MAG: metallophosphoesterase [Halobacteriota archaeon]